MRLTSRGQDALMVLVVLAAFAVGFLAWVWNPTTRHIDRMPVRQQDVVIEEDGSGTQYVGDQEVRTFPGGTFVWDCRTMGNRLCGPGH